MDAQTTVNTLVEQRTNPPGQIVNIDGNDAGQCTAIVHAFNLLCNMPLLLGNANQLFGNASPSLYQKVVNNPNDPNQTPPVGAIICFEADNRTIGTGQYGHCAVCTAAAPNSMTTLEQDDSGSEATMAAHLVTRPNYAGVYGWLVPLCLTYPAPAAPPAPTTTIATVTATAGLWMHTGPGLGYPHVAGEDANGNPIQLLPNGFSFQVKAIVGGDSVNGNTQWAQTLHNRYVSCAYLSLSEQGRAKGFLGRVGDLVKRS